MYINYLVHSVKMLFFLAYMVAAGTNADDETGIKDNKKNFHSREEVENYNELNVEKVFMTNQSVI